ncbi:MAG: c-type cytochrome [Mesorhizobium sp.]|nr:c-type cytochrome [Mesorhizobium sp.]MBL8577291.1 c-type cytochrome [Mesorhizobium sp.]
MNSKHLVIAVAALGVVSGLLFAVLTQDFSRNAETGPRSVAIVPAELAAQPATPPAPTFDPRFRSCAHCHQAGPGARNTSGPVLTGVLGRKSALTDYPYSRAMRAAAIVWDEPTLRAFLKAPQSIVPGTRMAFGGMSDADMDGLIAFLKEQDGQ